MSEKVYRYQEIGAAPDLHPEGWHKTATRWQQLAAELGTAIACNHIESLSKFGVAVHEESILSWVDVHLFMSFPENTLKKNEFVIRSIALYYAKKMVDLYLMGKKDGSRAIPEQQA